MNRTDLFQALANEFSGTQYFFYGSSEIFHILLRSLSWPFSTVSPAVMLLICKQANVQKGWIDASDPSFFWLITL